MKIVYQIIRWTARAMSAMVLSFIILNLITDYVGLFFLTTKELVLFLPLIGFAVGFVLAWFKEILGGAISLISVMLFMTLTQVGNEATYFILLNAFLFLIAGIIRKILISEQESFI